MAKRLFEESYAFDFFQAVRLLERIYPERRAIGLVAPPREEVVRLRAHLSMVFPPSQIYELEPPGEDRPQPLMTVAFMGLYGPSGVLPTHYTQMLLDLHRDVKGPERRALRDWLDLFNHRIISLFYRAWEKYRFYIPFERGEPRRAEPDAFTEALYCLLGMGSRPSRNRLRVAVPARDPEEPERRLARIDDLALFYYAGILTQRPRNAVNLRTLVADYFGLPVTIEQFRGQWLKLEPSSQTCLGATGVLGVDAVAGSRVWEVQSKFRVRLGPLTYRQFEHFLPDRAPAPPRKAIFLLAKLVRYFVGPELDFDVQLVLRADQVPECQIGESEGLGARLGWNTWLGSLPRTADAAEPVFDDIEVTWLGGKAS
ncbi:MAG TPA: type VI secretion system baseplate subunit TssG [Gemmataceae bacterium]